MVVQKEKIYSDKNYQNYWYLKRLPEIVIGSWKHYHDSTIMAVTIMIHRCIIAPLLIRSTFWNTSNEYPQHLFSWRNKKNIWAH